MEISQKVRSDIAGMLSAKAGIPKARAESLLERPPQIIDADLSFPVFSLAKKKKKPPADIAREISSKIKPKGYLKQAVAMGPYVNFHLDWARLGKDLLAKVLKEKDCYGSLESGREKVMVEFAHMNTLKAFHIGYIRNIIMGESLSRILEFSGKGVVRANYQGDIGPHIAKCLWGFLNIHKGKAPSKNQGIFLGKVYSEANRKARESERIQNEIREMNKSLYAGDPKLMPLWKKTRQWSLDYFDSIYGDFSTRFDRFYFESEMEGPAKKLAQALLKKGKAKKSEGAIVMDLKKSGLGVLVLLTGDGTPLYSIKDFVLAKLQDSEHSPSQIIHVVASEQNLYFRQLFKALERIHPLIAKKERHLSYGLVNLPSGKMSSREGNVVVYEDLKERLLKKALSETRKRNPKTAKKVLEEISTKVMMGALKYDMIKTSPDKVIVFDWDRALSLQGNTGPYLQYTHARACSILRKAKKTRPAFDASLLTDKEEIALLRTLLRFGESLAASARDFRPHYIANYAYELATAFNEFYEALPVMRAERKVMNARLALTESARIVLENSLNLLGIDAPERM